MRHIELFAGCGGLTLGLGTLGFELVMANELSPMAAETFAFNLLNEDLDAIAKDNGARRTVLKTKWLTSKHQTSDLQQRLKDNPLEFPSLDEGFTDISKPSDLKGSLIVGNISDVNRLLSSRTTYCSALKSAFGEGEIDLVSGGPPCQSFSLAGLRDRTNHRNLLPWEMAKFVQLVKPKAILLENVSGILRPFRDGQKIFYAWFEVAKAFAEVGYIPLCLHLNAKSVGTAQNRPRYVMLGLRTDIYNMLVPKLSDEESIYFESGLNLYKAISHGKEPSWETLACHDLIKRSHTNGLRSTFLKYLAVFEKDFIPVSEAIDDLKMVTPSEPSKYVKRINLTLGSCEAVAQVNNHKLRNNSPRVKSRFRIYQIQNELNNQDKKFVRQFLRGDVDSIPSELLKKLSQFEFLGSDGKFFRTRDLIYLEGHLKSHRTKKQSQRALLKNSPAPAALSIPDDVCHYEPTELRTLTVREIARIQSFPDSFVFRSKVTTGGNMRKFEVPQYTQVGNAVPPLLARALGQCIIDLLARL